MSCGMAKPVKTPLEKTQHHDNRLTKNQSLDYSCRSCPEYQFVQSTHNDLVGLSGDDLKNKMKAKADEYLAHWHNSDPLENKAVLGLGVCFAFASMDFQNNQKFIGESLDSMLKVLNPGCGVDPDMFKQHNKQTDAVLLYAAFWNNCMNKKDKHPVHPILQDILTMKNRFEKSLNDGDVTKDDLLASCDELTNVLASPCKNVEMLNAMVGMCAMYYIFKYDTSLFSKNEKDKERRSTYRGYMTEAVMAVLNGKRLASLSYQVALISLLIHLEWDGPLCPNLLDELLRFSYLPKWMHFYFLMQQNVQIDCNQSKPYDKCTMAFAEAVNAAKVKPASS